MSRNTLLEKIAADAAAEVEKINAASQSDCDAIKKETDTALAAIRSEAAAVLEKQKAQQELVATSKARQEGKLSAQTAKRAQLDALFAAVREEMIQADAATYEAFFTEKAKQILPTGLTGVQVAAPRNRTAETEKIMAAVGMAGEIAVDDSLAAGLVVTAKDGVYDVSFARIFNAVRPDIEMQIVTEFIQ